MRCWRGRLDPSLAASSRGESTQISFSLSFFFKNANFCIDRNGTLVTFDPSILLERASREIRGGGVEEIGAREMKNCNCVRA